MLSYLKFRYDLWQFGREEARLRRAHGEDIHDGQARFDWEVFYDEKSLLITKYWRRKAFRAFVPMPDHKDESCWEDCTHLDGRYLTMKGVSAVRTALREERIASLQIWGVIGSGLIGTIGAITGLIAIVKN
jgi:hypothetical protein